MIAEAVRDVAVLLGVVVKAVVEKLVEEFAEIQIRVGVLKKTMIDDYNYGY